MLDTIMTWLLRTGCYGIQIGGFALLAGIPAYLLSRKRKKHFLWLLVVLLTAECAGAVYLSENPIVTVPKAYRQYVTEEDRENIRSFNTGVYSANIPVFPVHIRVISANENEIRVRTQYLFWGYTEMSVTEDGPSLTKYLVN